VSATAGGVGWGHDLHKMWIVGPPMHGQRIWIAVTKAEVNAIC